MKRKAFDPGGIKGAQQHFAPQQNINKIVERLNNRQPFYGDFSAVPSLLEMHRIFKAVEEDFMKYPAEVRSRFGNDPVKMIAFLQNPENKEEAIKLHLVTEDHQSDERLEIAKTAVTEAFRSLISEKEGASARIKAAKVAAAAAAAAESEQ